MILAKNFRFLGHSLRLVSIIVFLFTCLLLISLPVLAQTATDWAESNSYLPIGSVVNDPLFAFGENVNLDIQARDDVYLAGANVIVKGVIDGDLIVAGAHIEIDAEVKGNLRVAGASVAVRGNVNGNVTIAAADLSIAENVEIGKNLIMAAGNATISCLKINKNLYGGVGNLNLNSEIIGNAYLQLDSDGTFIVYPKTNIHGTLQYKAIQTAEIKDGAKISKEDYQPLVVEPVRSKGVFHGFKMVGWVVSLLSTIIVGLLFVLLFKGFVIKTQKVIRQNILWLIIKGLVILIVTPITLIILAVTILGLPLALILGAVYGIALYLGKIFIAILLGNEIISRLKKKEQPLTTELILGLVVIWLFCLIPMVGFVVKLVATLWGLGLMFTVIKKQLNLAE